MKKISIGVALLVALAAAAVFLLRSSEEVKIEKMLQECAQAAERGEAEAILRHLTPTCTMGDSNPDALCARIRREVGALARGTKVDLGVSTTVREDEADVSLHIRVRALQHALGEGDFDLKLKKESGEWKIAKIEEPR